MYAGGRFFSSATRADKFNLLLDKYESEITAEQSIPDEFRSDSGMEYRLYAMGSVTSATLIPSVKKGEWYTEADSSFVPCVTYPDNEIGDIIDLNINNTVVQFEAVGIIDRNANVLKFNTASNKPSLEYLFDKEDETYKTPLIICDQADLPYDISFSADRNALIYFNTDDR